MHWYIISPPLIIWALRIWAESDWIGLALVQLFLPCVGFERRIGGIVVRFLGAFWGTPQLPMIFDLFLFPGPPLSKLLPSS